MRTKYGGLLIAVLVVGVLCPALCSAQFFKYRDESGAIRFTDDITQVPPDQRPDAKLYEDSGQYKPAGADADAPAAANAEESKDAIPAEDFEDREAEILSRKLVIDGEYDRLSAELIAINEAKKSIDGSDKDQVEVLNARIKAYRDGAAGYEQKRMQVEADMAKLRADRALHEAKVKENELREVGKKQKSQEKPAVEAQ